MLPSAPFGRLQARGLSRNITNDTSVKQITTPLLAGVNAIYATQRVVPGPDGSIPEPSKEFARRMRSKFVLKGPRKRTEGGSTTEPNITDKIAGSNGSGTEEAETSTSLPEVILESATGIDLFKEIKGRYAEDTVFKSIMENPKNFRNFEVRDGFIYIKLAGKELLCIPKVLVNGRSVHELVISEAHSMLAHLGANKTLSYLRDYVWWKDMVPDTRAYCDTCNTCKCSKPNNQKPYGLLNPLTIPSEPWESIGMDFVGPLPVSSNRDGSFDSITVVICLLTAMVELIPSRINYTAQDLAELMFENVYKHHGLPKNIVSDRDVLFTSMFWKHLHQLMGTSLKMSSAYHPQTDGSTERANRTITQMLRQCISPDQKNWVAKLPTIQFAINSARSGSTGYAPFYLNNGRMPRAMIWNSASPTEYPNVRIFAQKKKLALMSAHDSVIAARVKQTRDANRKRQEAPFKEGDLVYLSTKNISFAKGLARKFIPKYIGPYKILKDYNNQSFKIELPAHMKQRGVHDKFHASLLRIHEPNDDRLFPGRMDTQIGEGLDVDREWAVEQIRSHHGSAEDSVFEIEWKSGDVTWMPYYQVQHLQALDNYMELLGVRSIADLSKGKGKPPLEDPQIFLGTLQLSPSTDVSFPALTRLQNSPPIPPVSPSPTTYNRQSCGSIPDIPVPPISKQPSYTPIFDITCRLHFSSLFFSFFL